MSNKFTALIIVLIVGAIALVYFFIPFEDPAKVVETQKNGDVAGEDSYVPDKIVADHYFANGTHSLEGVVSLPTPCHSLSAQATVAESMPEQVTIAFTSVASDGICTQVIDEKFFSVSFQASAQAVIKATFNGNPVNLVLSQRGEAIQKL